MFVQSVVSFSVFGNNDVIFGATRNFTYLVWGPWLLLEGKITLIRTNFNYLQIDGLVQDCSNSRAIAKDLYMPSQYGYIIETTRSTPKAQTSATPSLKSVKQSTQAWNIVAYCFLCPYPENFMNVHPSGIPWCCQPTRTQKIEKGTLCPRGYTYHPQNVPDCSLCHSQNIMKISWKSTHRFYRGVTNKHVRSA